MGIILRVALATIVLAVGVVCGAILTILAVTAPSYGYAAVEQQPNPRKPLPEYQKGLESTVVVEMASGSCTGVIESDYVLVTATHCLAKGNGVEYVTTYDGGRFTRYANPGRIIYNDGADHVKVRMEYKLRGRHAKLVPMPPPGSPIYVYGHPADTRYQLRLGRVQGQYRAANDVLYDVIDIEVWHGDSGGAIFDRHGNVVGLVSGYFNDTNPLARSTWKLHVTQPWAFQ